MNYEIEYNARSIPAADVAKSFVCPEPHFVRLLSRSHTLLLGPRGSGKTTLLKMLSLRALRNWEHPDASRIATQISFNGAFVAADRAWGKQIDALGALNLHPGRKEAAFVIHTLRALVFAMRESSELGRVGAPSHLAHLATSIDATEEEKFVKLVAPSLDVSPALNTMLGLEIALEQRLDAINSGESDGSFSVNALASKLRILISAFNGLTGDDDRRWALLFDEIEIAPPSIQKLLLSGIRSIDERIVIKLAIAPYMGDVEMESGPSAPQPYHDYHTVELTYPNKDDAKHFSEQLFLSVFARMGISITSLDDAFERPDGTSGFGRKLGQAKRLEIPREFRSLANKDSSFRQYISERKLFDASYRFSEDNVAKDIRKVLPIVIARDYYLRLFDSGHVVTSRSRKSHVLYTGYPSVVEATEGNPRAILTFLVPLLQVNAELPISAAAQSLALRRVEILLTSLLQVIPLDLGGFAPRKGLLDFVDQIGRAFEQRLLRQPFSTDYVGTFLLDDNVTAEVISAVGRALNAGALIHVPHQDAAPDSLLRGLVGQRFRISYALAPRFRLLLTLGDRITLSGLLKERRVHLPSQQASLFGEGGADDQG